MSAELVRFVEARIAEWETEAHDAIRERKRGWDELDEPDYLLKSWRGMEGDIPAVLVGPELVLRQCEAFRRIVGRGQSECGGYQASEGLGTHYPDPGWSYCDGCSAAESSDLDWERTLRHLASIWSDHPDYDEEWE